MDEMIAKLESLINSGEKQLTLIEDDLAKLTQNHFTKLQEISWGKIKLLALKKGI